MKFNAYDTETIKGFARIVATPKKYWQVNSFESAIRPMIIEGTNYGTSFFTWNINYDMRAILKYLPEDNLNELAQLNETIYEDLYKIFYIEGKVCSISYEGFETPRRIAFYDAAQYYNYKSLDSMAQQYLGSKKIDNSITNLIKSKQDLWPIETMELFYKKNFDIIGQYCRKDAILTANLGKYIHDKIYNVFNIDLRRFTSKAAISEKLSYQKGKYPINFGEGSKSYNYSQLAFRGGMFDCWQRGFFPDEVTEIDISSAYPDVQKDLPHWGNGKFYEITKESEIDNNDFYGWILAGFDCPYIPYDTEQNEMWKEYHEKMISNENPNGEVEVLVPERKRVYYPYGYRYQIITLAELKFLKKYGYKYDIEDGFVWHEINNEFQSPFHWIPDMYAKKAEFKVKYGKDSIEYMLVKIALNGTYGKTCQTVGLHVMQDFRYASYITALTRIKLISFILDHNLEKYVIMIATDGIYLNGHKEFDNLGSGLGSWDIDHYDSGLFLGNGLYQLRGDKPKLKLRGYGSGKYTFKDYNPLEFNLIDSIRKHANESIYQPTHKAMHKRKPNSFKMCLNLLDYTKDDMNKFAYRDKGISAVSDKTKKWPGIETFNDLLNNQFTGIRYTIEEIEGSIWD
ncbi:MAG: hypothetical protein KAI81_04435 [Candidatus Marinimicrobia bacterium]|nr:hypothetical protein [Candidatus Neomarinimicrobiota bacterium]